MSESRWSLWIDVEGFSESYRSDETRALLALGWLMEAIFKIGVTIYSRAPARLFAHQFGDGFVIVSNFPEDSSERPLAISISLMRHLIARGVACKAAVACGGFADVGGCYPEIVMELAPDRHVASMGEGLMTLIPVMGTALIESCKLSHERKGAVLLLRNECFRAVPEGVIVTTTPPSVVDWVHSDLALSRRISSEAGLTYLDAHTTQTALRKYIDTHRASAGYQWVSATVEANGL